ncbi:glycoside hydrolase family 3 N-terminal domain-containing protein [Paenibacillus sp. UASWS1643]|uniref:glycoside hydrolase family 3 N-terminal domain-containing protein n=1 Tax=Paenibacillus sp. UASWS1643 TaxID=2580422 RepID=UPI001239EA4B|nr:glycoside hydrolase family 3 N-terminal domain-containing protein [Paenibacillus sp. UASWS1643]KAA8745385.1 beta-glucosidase [Paenibacillus sp. UASWS1643]
MIYKDASKSIHERVEDLIGRMTLREKVAQLYCANSYGGESVYDTRKEKLKNGIGTISYLNDSFTGEMKKDQDSIKGIQQFLVEETRLGIPALIHSEGIAGAQIPSATTFPQSLNLASTWDPTLAETMGEIVKKQLRAFGFRAVHSPLFDLGRDPRFGRISETYGEDPYLVARIGVSFVKGIQGDHELMATAKHFVGYGNAEGGRGGGEQQISERRLLDSYCFPFEAAIHEANVKAIMNSYGMLNDQAVATSKWLLTDILRNKLGFKGLVVADYGSITHAFLRYRVAEDAKEAGILALKAGMDVEQPGNQCYQHLVEAVELGELNEAQIDVSLRRILETKFTLGLFEKPYEEGDFFVEIKKTENAELSQEIAEKSMVLVKNEEAILPLKKNLKVALIGPNSDTKTNFFGGYSSVGSASTRSSDFDKSEEDSFLRMMYAGTITDNKESLKSMGIEFEDQPTLEQKEIIMNMIRQNLNSDEASNKVYKTNEEFVHMFYPDCKSVKDVMEETFGKDHILHAKGCNIFKAIDGGIESVKAAVEQADVVIAVLGGKESMIDPEATCGENKDNINIGLEKPQLEMMEEVFKLNKPVISVIVDGRPLATPFVSEHSKAVLYSWLPAQSGANAIVNILTGKKNPSGKLPVTIVKESGQIPMYNSRLPLYADIDEFAEYIRTIQNEPLYPFGHGLSYSHYKYSDLVHDVTVQTDGELNLEFKLNNTGQVAGDEVVQVYIRDRVSSVARPVKQLVGFARVTLDVNEIKNIAFKVDMKQLAFHDLNMDQVVEPGKMEVFIGASSQDIRLKGAFEIMGEKLLVERKVFSSKVMII